MTPTPRYIAEWPEVNRPSSVSPGGLADALLVLNAEYSWTQLARFTGISRTTLHKIAHDPKARIHRDTYKTLVDALWTLRGGDA